MAYLDKINSPEDLKKLNTAEMEALAGEIRSAVLNRDSKIGGHVGPNLGIVETAIALHYVFDSPKDKIVYDVSHQSYPHKILTGRKNGFLKVEEMGKISGYTNPNESEHDFFVVGHTSTSVSLACGLAKARDLRGEKHNVIAVIGDGSLSGGEALEGLSNAAVLDSNIIIVVNDHEMSIAEHHGGLYTNLRLLWETGGKAECNMFKALGFDYRYVGDGKSVEALIGVLGEVKDTPRPTVVHVHTLKGKGYKFAEENKERWHWNLPFDIKTGEVTVETGGDVTHLGCFDIPLIGNIPNIVYLAPAGKAEYLAMLDCAVEQTAHPVVIRIPSEVRPSVGEVEKDYGRLNRYQTVKRGEKVAVLGLGSFFALGQRVVERLRERGIEATLINPHYITGLDGELLTSLKADHQLVATLEDGELDGGFGEKIARFYGADPMKVLTFGAKKEFTDRVPLDELYRRYHLTPEQIADDIMKAL